MVELLLMLWIQTVTVPATWQWTNASGPVEFYEMAMTTDNGVTWSMIELNITPMNGNTQFTITPPLGMKYKVRVRAGGTAGGEVGYGEWSEASAMFSGTGKPGKPKLND